MESYDSNKTTSSSNNSNKIFRTFLFNHLPKIESLLRFFIFFALFAMAITVGQLPSVFDDWAKIFLFFGFGTIVGACLYWIVRAVDKKTIANQHPISNFLKSFLIDNQDKVIVNSLDERKTYTGRYIDLQDDERHAYLSNYKEKSAGFSHDKTEIIDIGFNLYIKVPMGAICRIEESTDC